MIAKDTEICVCNSVSAGELAQCIKKHSLKTLEDVLENEECNVGDKCESCKDEGFNNDGLNIPLVLALVKRDEL